MNTLAKSLDVDWENKVYPTRSSRTMFLLLSLLLGTKLPAQDAALDLEAWKKLLVAISRN